MSDWKEPDWIEAYEALQDAKREAEQERLKTQERHRAFGDGARAAERDMQGALEVAASPHYDAALTLALRDLLRMRIADMREKLARAGEPQYADAEVERLMRDEDARRMASRNAPPFRLSSFKNIERMAEQVIHIELPELHYRLRFDLRSKTFR